MPGSIRNSTRNTRNSTRNRARTRGSGLSKVLAAVAVVATVAAAAAQEPASETALERSLAQLRHVVGGWDVVTEMLNPDGTVAGSASGTYDFEWAVPGRVVRGISEIPELGQRSAILFFVDEARAEIEMVSVGADGRLWRMRGPLGGETRTTEEYATADGGTGQLRFTRYAVSADRFESKMEWTDDGGATWHPGNHQVFVRRVVAR
ncbi:MAG: hypothetical protein DWQ36_18925 [Acidobacteria bacterium]|nr:MAG: hypothetical protein DWQ30_11270 [Acidobacteriota bacterium]REK03847.1 MAG: hypothetical protein DWQ36_18925 [Acidobacteriota bacterium]